MGDRTVWGDGDINTNGGALDNTTVPENQRSVYSSAGPLIATVGLRHVGDMDMDGDADNSDLG